MIVFSLADLEKSRGAVHQTQRDPVAPDQDSTNHYRPNMVRRLGQRLAEARTLRYSASVVAGAALGGLLLGALAAAATQGVVLDAIRDSRRPS